MEDRMQGHFSTVRDTLNVSDEGSLTPNLDPLSLDIPDEDLVEVFDKRLEKSREFFAEHHNLYERRSKNELFYFGKQVQDLEKQRLLKDYDLLHGQRAL